MNESTQKKTHELLEKLANYVMNEVPRKSEFNKLAKKVDSVEGKVDTIIDSIEGQAQQLDIIRTEQLAMHRGLDREEERIEEHEKAGH